MLLWKIPIYFETRCNRGRLSPKLIMTDIAPQFYNAWVAINIGSRPQQLYCTVFSFTECGQGMERRAKKEIRESRHLNNQMKKVLMNT
jgi:hypothetical protein